MARDLFEIENAKNLTRDELVATFVPTKSFWRLLSPKNHIVLGARGSGKTALAKMLSHDHLSRFRDERAVETIRQKALIGIYVATNLEWAGSLKNKPWLTATESEQYFQWRLNIATCAAALITFRSCLLRYVTQLAKRAELERNLCFQLSRAWFGEGTTLTTVRDLQLLLAETEHEKQRSWDKRRVLGRALTDEESMVGISFDMPLFAPLRRAVGLAADCLGFPEHTVWVLCLDEAEWLDDAQQRILNSHLRSRQGSLVFKIATMPYKHVTLETNLGVSLSDGHDFEYVYIDRDPISNVRVFDGFAKSIFDRRASLSGSKYRGTTAPALLGPSRLLDPDQSPGEVGALLDRCRQEATRDTVARAERLAIKDMRRFMDQIGRKIRPALILRDAVQTTAGRGELDVYSGYSMVVRCSDGNPRRLVRMFNALLQEARPRKGRVEYGVGSKWERVPPMTQTRILIQFSASSLTRVQSEPPGGRELHLLLEKIGAYMRSMLHDHAISTDYVSSVEVDASVPDLQWKAIQQGVGAGLLFPNVSAENPDQMPDRSGTFHMAYVLAPTFRILPRRGKARRLSTILEWYATQGAISRQPSLPLGSQE